MRFQSSLIKNINLKRSSTWQNKIFITIDVDWAHDKVLSDTLDLIDSYDCHATIFATHSTTILSGLKTRENFEIGIHPNFNFLLEGDFRYGDTYKEIVKYYIDLFPDAMSVRSHSMTQNTPILRAFTDYDLKFDCNNFLPYIGETLSLYPFLFWDKKLIRVPYFWEDDINMLSYNQKFSARDLLNTKGLRVFDFHPIHLYLNSYSIDHYNTARPYFYEIDKLESFVNSEKYGVRDFFVELLNELK